MNNLHASTILNQAIADSQELLTTYVFSEGLLAKFTTVFGSKYDRRFKRFVSDPLSLQQAY
ncbi:MAG: hypothetical protein QNJ34_26170 [Xenococcaceae cyanobacterium MO_188.B29]|nr:hypothetical protein [Xenococcaceae cyanobacterium MO_188.B29]